MTKTKKEPTLPRDFFKRALNVASYYGFQPFENAIKGQEKGHASPRLKTGDHASIASVCFPAGSRLPEPLLFFYVNEHPRSLFEKTEDDQAELNLEVVGTSKSIAEAILIKTTLSIFEENGVDDAEVILNGIGNRDSFTRFTRELSAHYRRHLNDMHAQCRHNFVKDVLRLLSCDNEDCRALQGTAPRVMNFLNEAGRVHFREVLEYLERLGIPYAVKDSLFGPRDHYSKIVFEIRRTPTEAQKEAQKKKSEEHEEEPFANKQKGYLLATGGRYDDLARRVTSRKDAAGVGISLFYPRRLSRSRMKIETRKQPPKAYFVHIGTEAKLKSLLVLDLLRKARISVHQAFHHDQLSGQLISAEKLGIPYLLIMGQKEALEDTVIVRDIETRAQNTVSIPRLSLYLKSLA